MKWRKLGKIFAPDGSRGWMQSHATLPLARVLADDIACVYFSTRDRENRSQLAYLLIDLNEPQEILELSPEPLLSPGAPGTFDDSGVMATELITIDGKLYLYYIGWNLSVTVPFRNAIGLAISEDDGATFRKYSDGPIIDRSIHDPCLVASNSVLYDEGRYRHWYLSGTSWSKQGSELRHHYHIKYAESDDGINWRREGKIAIDFKDENEYAISTPRVIKEDNLYKMWYSYRGESYRIGYAESEDGLIWQRLDDAAGIDVSPGEWDGEMVCYPFILDHGGRRYMFYNGDGYGRSGLGLAVLEE